MFKGDIYTVNLKQSTGSVQAGIRPAIIVQNNIGNQFSPTVIICPITTANKKHMPTHCYLYAVGGLKEHSIALCEQIITVNKTDLIQYIGTVKNKRILEQLDKCIKCSLGIKEKTYVKSNRRIKKFSYLSKC